jgi:hypothetical protein
MFTLTLTVYVLTLHTGTYTDVHQLGHFPTESACTAAAKEATIKANKLVAEIRQQAYDSGTVQVVARCQLTSPKGSK